MLWLVPCVAMKAHLARLEGQEWPDCYLRCSKVDVMEYVELSREIRRLTGELQEAIMGTKAAQNALVPGRIVQLTNQAGLVEVAYVCDPLPPSSLAPLPLPPEPAFPGVFP